MSSFGARVILSAAMLVVAANIALGGYLFLQFVSTFAQSRRWRLWMTVYAVGCVVFVGGLGTILKGGVLLLCGNLPILVCAALLCRRHLTAQQAAEECPAPQKEMLLFPVNSADKWGRMHSPIA